MDHFHIIALCTQVCPIQCEGWEVDEDLHKEMNMYQEADITEVHEYEYEVHIHVFSYMNMH
jgi:hypothetical protein